MRKEVQKPTAVYERKFELIYSIFADFWRHENKAEYRDQYLLDNNGGLQRIPSLTNERTETSKQWVFWKFVRIWDEKLH